MSFKSSFLIRQALIGHDPVPAKVCDCVGGVVSPLLANIYLARLDRVLEAEGVSFVRYADDGARPKPLF
jgi:hypothetical protein